jgi:hypothetical protein
MGNEMNIKDSEIRIIGATEPVTGNSPDPGNGSDGKKPSGKGWKKAAAWIALGILAVAGILLLVLHYGGKEPENVPGVFEPVPSDSTVVENTTPVQALDSLGDYSDTTGKAYTEVIAKTINDVPLTILIPHHATAELFMGVPDTRDKSIVLATHAADIRRDNKKIVGAFVLKGEPLAWGLSKKGYCGIIDGKITVGVADNSPLFEEATEKGGYFFRQYPLVDNGQLVENEPKNKSYRKALCERAGEIFIVKSETEESFHDFAQALVDLGCNNAIYLIGSTAYGYYYDKESNLTEFFPRVGARYRFENFIIWRAN